MATTIHWKSAHSGLFSAAADWTPAQVPLGANAAFIDAAGAAYTVTVNNANTINTLAMVAGSTLDIVGSSFALLGGSDTGGLNGTIIDENGSSLSLGGAIANHGVIREAAGANTTYLTLNSNVVLTGGGQLVLGGTGANDYLYGASGATVLDNVANSISGAGNLGDGQLTLTNEAAGIIDASGATALVVNTGGSIIVNRGLLTATAAGGLVLESEVDQRGGGGILANGGVVSIVNTVIGGTLAGSQLQDSGYNGELDGQGTHAVTNAGTLTLLDNTRFYLAGSINNTGLIFLDGSATSGAVTDLVAASPLTVLSGGGRLVLSDSGNNRIYANNGNFELVNANEVISGAGQLGANQLHFINQSIVDATGSNALQLNTSGNYLTNTGLLESTNPGGLAITGGLQIYDTPVINAGGTVLANGAHSHVDLANGATIIGGTLQTAGGGVIQTISGTDGLDGQTDGALTNTGAVLVSNQTDLDLAGAIVNSGTIFVDDTQINGAVTDLIINGAVTTLSGGGTLLLSNDFYNRVYAGNNRLINVNNTIVGAGQFGVDQTNFTNDSAGIVDANGTAALQLQFNFVTTNAGLLEATNTVLGNGGLVIYGTTLDNAGGTIEALGTNAHVDLNSSYIEAGIIGAAGTGVVNSLTGTTNTLDGVTAGEVTVKGVLQVNDNSVLQLVGTIVDDGTIFDNSVNTNTDTDVRIVGSQTTLAGGGAVRLSDSDNNRVYGTGTLTNVNDVISGSGNIGVGQNNMVLVNQAGGVIDANQATSTTASKSGVLYLDTATPVTNLGLLESTNTGGLRIYNTQVYNQGGTVEAIGAGAIVALQSGGTITGGTLITNGTGAQIGVLGGSYGRLDGLYEAPVILKGLFQVNDLGTLQLAGAIDNLGTLNLDAVTTGGNTDITVDSQTVTLTGGGTLAMSNDVYNRIYGDSAELLNLNNTIVGSGQIGVGISSFVLANAAAGVIDANQVEIAGSTSTTGQLTIDTNSNDSVNAGLIEASAGGTLLLENSGIVNTGTMAANGANSRLNLGGGTVIGGRLATSGGGLIQIVGGYGTSGLDGASDGALTNTGTIALTDGTRLNLAGIIDNTGTIEQLGATGNTDLVLTNPLVKLTGGGEVLLSDYGGNRIYGNASTFTLDNVNNTIAGAGQIGVGQTTLLNTGTIDANQALAITLNTGNQLLDNEAGGLLEGTGAGGLIIDSGLLINNGTILAGNASSVTLQPNLSDSNAELGELTGGTWSAVSTGAGATLAITGGAVTTDSANIVLSGAKSVFEAGNGTIFTTLETSLTSISSVGTLQVLGGRGFVTANTITDQGVLALGGGAFTSAGVLTVGASAVLRGVGVVTPAVVSAGLLEAIGGGTLALTGAVTSTGPLEALAASVLQLHEAALTNVTTAVTLNGAGSEIQFGVAAAFTTIEQNLTGIAAAGTLAVLGNRGYVTAKAIADSGLLQLAGGTFSTAKLTVAGGGSVTGFGTIAGPVSNAGTLGAAGGTLALTGGLVETGTLTAAAGATLALAGGGTIAGAVTGAGALALSGAAAFATTGAVNVGLAVINAANVAIGSGPVAFLGAMTNSGTIAVGGGAASFSDSVGGTGKITIGAAGTAKLLAGSAASEGVGFLAAGGALDLATPLAFGGTISGFVQGDKIDLLATIATGKSFAGGVLTLTDGGTVAKLHMAGTYSTASFQVVGDGHAGTLITHT